MYTYHLFLIIIFKYLTVQAHSYILNVIVICIVFGRLFVKFYDLSLSLSLFSFFILSKCFSRGRCPPRAWFRPKDRVFSTCVLVCSYISVNV